MISYLSTALMVEGCRIDSAVWSSLEQEAAQRALHGPAAMEADEGRAASGAAAEAPGQLNGGIEKMDIEPTDKRWVPMRLNAE